MVRVGLSEKLKRVTSGLRIILCGELGTFAELKEVALDVQRSGLKRVKVRLEIRKGLEGAGPYWVWI